MMNQNAQTVIIDIQDDGIRLDKWFKKYYPELAFGQLQKLFRTGQVRLDGKRVKADTRVSSHQAVRVPPFKDADDVVKRPMKIKAISEKEKAFIQSLVIYQDDDVIAINKPPNIAVQGGSKVTIHIDGLLDGLKNDQDDERPKLVHRLDKETSGVLLLARNSKSARALGYIFKEHRIRKYYWAITVPAPEQNQGTINVPLNKLKGRGGERVMRDDEDGKRAITHFALIERAAKTAAWMAFWPQTGRTHQIRVHAALMGTPLLGDHKYGFDHGLDTEKDVHFYDNEEIYQGIHLHARRLILPHPIYTHKKIDITAALPPEMLKTWSYFHFNANDKSDPFADLEID